MASSKKTDRKIQRSGPIGRNTTGGHKSRMVRCQFPKAGVLDIRVKCAWKDGSFIWMPIRFTGVKPNRNGNGRLTILLNMDDAHRPTKTNVGAGEKVLRKECIHTTPNTAHCMAPGGFICWAEKQKTCAYVEYYGSVLYLEPTSHSAAQKPTKTSREPGACTHQYRSVAPDGSEMQCVHCEKKFSPGETG